MESALWEYVDEGQPGDEVPVIVRLFPGRPMPPGLRIVAQFDLIATARVERRNIVRIRDEVASMKRPQNYSPAPWDEDDEAEAPGDLTPRPSDERRNPGLPTGRGTVLCHLDWGLDWTHKTFRKADGKTRLLALWDQGGKYDPAHPNRYGFGRVYTRDEIDRALASADPLAAIPYRWWASDRGIGSHGSHTLGISGGSGIVGLPAGLATDADLLFVDLTSHTPEGPQALGSSTDLLEGVDFANRIAGDRSLIINASLGRQAGQKDGLTLTEQALDQFCSSRAGRVMAMSCGNYFAKHAHAHVILLPGETHTLALDMAAGQRKAEVDLWYPRSDRLLVAVSGPQGLAAGPLGPDQRAQLDLHGKRVGRLYCRSDDPNNGDHQVSLFLDPDAPDGRWTISLTGVTVGDGRVHAWVERDPTSKARLRFIEQDDDPRFSLGTICCGFATLAVAAYDGHSSDRPPGAFSSSSPTRDERLSRPSFCAPGVKVLSARSTPRDRRAAPVATRMSGTSMAAPFAAGTVALLFEAAPRALWIDDIRALLVDTVDVVPAAQRERLGAGYINVAAAVDAARRIAPRPAIARTALLPPLAPRAQLHLPSTQEYAMSEHDIEQQEQDLFECNADDEAEVMTDGESGLDGESADMLGAAIEGEEEDNLADQSEANRRGGDGFAPLPFQFQIPIGGSSGGLGLAVPIGGRNSPFALSLPLGGQTPSLASPAPVAAPAAAAPTALASQQLVPAPVGLDAPLVTALDLPPDPVAIATEMAVERGEVSTEACSECVGECGCDAAAAERDEAALAEALRIDLLEREFVDADYGEVDARYAGEQLMGAVSSSMGQHFESPSEVLESLGEAIAAESSDAASESGTENVSSLFDLFRSVADGGERLPRLLGRRLRVVARPGSTLASVSPLRGDILLRSLPGHRFVQLSFLADGDLVSLDRLPQRGWRAEGNGDPLPGRYVQVVELWPVAHREADGYARRLANAADLVAPDTMLLRLRPAGDAQDSDRETENDPVDPAQPTLSLGARGTAVVALQQRLNQLDAHRTAAGLIGLGNMPLAEDGHFGPRLRAAVQATQRLAPAGLIPNPTGAMDRATWQALALLEAALAGLAIPPAPRPPGPTGANSIAAGQVVVDYVPMLAVHRGTPPDLMLRWNAMPAATDRVDIVVHLHGFSGQGPAMRIDRDKMPKSGLDFANPDNPAEAGRTAPTLAILPRGNYYGGASHMGYDFPALVEPGALSRLMSLALERFAASVGIAHVTAGRLILTAHSGGGAPLMRLLANYDPDEVFTFDALYGRPHALIRWAEAKLHGANASTSALCVLFRAGEGTAAHSAAVAAALRPLVAGHPELARRFRVEPVRQAHNDIPRWHGWRLLLDAGADFDGDPRRTSPPREADAGAEVERWIDQAEDEPAAPGLSQEEVARLAACEFSNTDELERYFNSAGNFADWFNRELSGHAPFARPGGGGALRVPTGDSACGRFRGFWDRLDLAYRHPRISLLEFASLMAIVLNETDGDFAGRTESSGRGGGGRTDRAGRHPGLAYFFDRIELRPGHFKASYNHLSGGRTAGRLFDDPVHIRAHGALGGADRLARHGQEFDGAWNGSVYPVVQGFPTDEHDPSTAFIREADFYKFRGRGIIQTTGRASYVQLVRTVKAYRGTDPTATALAAAWSAMPDDDVCTASTNEDWERLFALPMTLGMAFALHSPGYRMMSRDAAILNAVPAAGHRGQAGSIYLMGRRISGSHDYGAHLYRDRVLNLLRAMLRLPLAASPGQQPARPGHLEPEHPQRQRDPDPTRHAPSGQLEPENPQRQRDPQPSPSLHGGQVRPRGPVAAPDAETARQQWAANPGAHQYFPRGEEQYLRFAPMFARRGVPDAAAYLANSIVDLSFFGRRQPGHRALAAPLAATEAALSGHALDPPLTSFGCLNVREIAGTGRLSFHALGLAIDLNPGSNPHIKVHDDFMVIQAVTGVNLPQERDRARLREASQHFQRDLTPAWMSGQSDPRILAALQQPSTRRRLEGYARTGFCTLDEALIGALLGAGVTWGGAWSSSKDFMHFELP